MVTKFETYNVDTVIDMINNVDINSNNMDIHIVDPHQLTNIGLKSYISG